MSEKFDISLKEALDQRKNLKGKLDKLSTRFQANFCYKDDKKPEFSFEEDLAEYQQVSAKLVRLEAAMAKANALRMVKVPSNWKTRISEDQISLGEAIRWRDEAKSEVSKIKSLIPRNGIEKKDEYVWNPDLDKSVHMEKTETWTSALTERSKDEMVTLLEEMCLSMDSAINRVNASSKI